MHFKEEGYVVVIGCATTSAAIHCNEGICSLPQNLRGDITMYMRTLRRASGTPNKIRMPSLGLHRESSSSVLSAAFASQPPQLHVAPSFVSASRQLHTSGRTCKLRHPCSPWFSRRHMVCMSQSSGQQSPLLASLLFQQTETTPTTTARRRKHCLPWSAHCCSPETLKRAQCTARLVGTIPDSSRGLRLGDMSRHLQTSIRCPNQCGQVRDRRIRHHHSRTFQR
mmetsp:Transcript_69902/g.167800  ORF Transcript_69902/g.167800 Transcript_69902/m.167800 type:complete len:224 (+) Transcript_69902:139-810(+)